MAFPFSLTTESLQKKNPTVLEEDETQRSWL